MKYTNNLETHDQDRSLQISSPLWLDRRPPSWLKRSRISGWGYPDDLQRGTLQQTKFGAFLAYMHARLVVVFAIPLVFAILSCRSGTPATKMRLGRAPTPLLHSIARDRLAKNTTCTLLLALRGLAQSTALP